MAAITITCTGEQKNYHDHWKPFLCTSDKDLPKQYNAGMNSFRFVGGEPEFISKDIPLILKNETNNYIFYECQIEVLRKDGTKVIGCYMRTDNKEDNSISSENFHFD
jgi:hypothetical protein